MNRNDEIKTILQQTRFKVNPSLNKLIIGGIIFGAIGFIIGISGETPHLAWQALLVNTVFFGGLSLGGIVFSAILTITNARWGRPIKRLSEAMVGFIPIYILLFILLFFGADHLFEWMDPGKVIPSKAGWLNFPFFVIRNSILFILFTFFSWLYFKTVVRPDIGLAKKLDGFNNLIANRLSKNYDSQKNEEVISRKKSQTLAPILALLFPLLCTLLAFDWIMSLDQEWFSSLFGMQYAVANLLGVTALLMIISGIVRRRFHLHDHITLYRYHDISKLTFSACLLWTYMIFSQVLVIWYGNLPEETPYLILRMQSAEWGWMFWLLMVLLFILPFLGLINRKACSSIRFSRLIAIEILVGLWLEKYFLIVPSIQENRVRAETFSQGTGLPGFSFNLYDLSITIGVLAAFIFSYLWILQRVPLVPISDELFLKKDKHEIKGV